MSLNNSFYSDFGSNSGGGSSVQGIQGIQGIIGLQGIQGSQGIQGDLGGVGFQGLQGLGGQIGSQGIQGVSGGASSQGTQGLQGLTWTMYEKIPKVAGQTYTNGNGVFGGGTSTTYTANYAFLYPVIFRQSFTTSSLCVNVGTSLSASLLRLLIYSNGTSGSSLNYPESKLYESTDIDWSTTGIKTIAVNFTFQAGVAYWLGAYQNNTIQIICWSQANFGVTNTIQLNAGVALLTTFGSIPSTWDVINQTRTNQQPIRIGLNIQNIL